MNLTVAGTNPYAWPWDDGLAGSRLALVVAGDDPASIERCHTGERVLALIDELAQVVRATGGLIVHLVQAPKDPLSPSVTDSFEAGSGLSLPRGDGDVVVTVRGVDGFYASDLDHALRSHGRDQLGLCGFGLETAVHSTLRSANDRGYECLLVSDASASLDPDLRDASLSIVTMSGGIFGALGTANALIEALTANTVHDVDTPPTSEVSS